LVQYQPRTAYSVLYKGTDNLTHRSVITAKPREADYRMTDSRQLYLLVKKNGTKAWRLDYKYDGKRKTLALGTLDDVPLSRAREKRNDARALLDQGFDPSQKKKDETRAEAAASLTFKATTNDWLERERISKEWAPTTYTAAKTFGNAHW
jgi:hypothetical protein